MKILVVSPVPPYATRDVWTGHVQGLREIDGVEVLPMNYSSVYNLFADFKEFMEVTGQAKIDTINNQLMAADRIVMAAIANEVDLVHLVAPMHLSPVALKVLQKYTNIKTSAYFTECPYDDENSIYIAEYLDFCFVCDRESVPVFKERNPNTFYLGHAYNPDIHQPKEVEQDVDVLFVGTNFPTRVQFLEKVNWEGINFQLRGIWNMRGKSSLKQFIQGESASMRNEHVLELYQKARIGLQIHRKDGFSMIAAKKGKTVIKGGLVGATPMPDLVAHSLGPRSYELAASGCFQVSDAERPELQEVFGDTVPTYETPEDLRVLMRMYLDDPVRREEVAKKQLQAVQPYTFEYRMRGLLDAVA